MANKFWIGVNTSWNDTANWAATDGGVGGEDVPIAGDKVYFTDTCSTNCIVDANVACAELHMDTTGEIYTGIFDAKTYTVTITAGVSMKWGTIKTGTGAWSVAGGITMTGGTFTVENTPLTVTGGIAASGGTFTAGSGTITVTGTVSFSGCTFVPSTASFVFLGTCTLTTTGGISIYNVAIGSVAATATSLTLGSNLTVTHALTVGNGAATTFVISGYTLTITTSINLTNLDTFTRVKGWVELSGTDVSVTCGGKTFTGLVVHSTGTITFADDITATIFECCVPSAILSFIAGITATFTNCLINGDNETTPVCLVSGTPGTPYTLASTTRNFSNLSVTDCTSSGVGDFYASTGACIDGGGNTGWIFRETSRGHHGGGMVTRGNKTFKVKY